MSTEGVRGGNFLRLWSGQTLAQFGRQLGSVALPIVSVQLLRADATQLGILNAAETAAFLLVGLPAGAWVDRWYKRPTMIVADIVRAVAALAIPMLYLTGHLAIWHLYVVGLVLGLATVFFDVCYQSYIPLVVPDAEIGTANSRMETSSQVATLSGPALGGLLLKWVSAPLLMLADALGYIASFAFLLFTRDHEREERGSAEPRERKPLLHEIGEGLRFVWSTVALRRIATSTCISNLCSSIVFTLSPLLLLRLMGFSGFLFGIVVALGSAGGLLGAVATPWLRKRIHDAVLIPGGMLVAAFGMLSYPVAYYAPGRATQLAIIIAGQLLIGVGVLVYNITQVTLRQRLCPRHLLGRMNASIRFVVWGIMPIASLLAGVLGRYLGTVPAVWLGCVLGFTAFLPLLGLRAHIPAEKDAATDADAESPAA